MIDYQNLVKIVENARFEFYEELTYDGINFLLFPGEHTEKEKEDGIPPIFYNISSIADWDIYFSTNVVPEDFKQAVLLHEIVEITIFSKFRLDSSLTYQESLEKAHNLAIKYDQRYARETLSEERFREYLLLREKLMDFSF